MKRSFPSSPTYPSIITSTKGGTIHKKGKTSQLSRLVNPSPSQTTLLMQRMKRLDKMTGRKNWRWRENNVSWKLFKGSHKNSKRRSSRISIKTLKKLKNKIKTSLIRAVKTSIRHINTRDKGKTIKLFDSKNNFSPY